MTVEAVARRTNVPLEKVQFGITHLMQPDPKSRSHEHEGRRLIPIDSRRDWGWIVVNYEHYRAIQDEESRRASWRDAKAKQRKKKGSKPPKNSGELPGETEHEKAVKNGATQEQLDEIITRNLPAALR